MFKTKNSEKFQTASIFFALAGAAIVMALMSGCTEKKEEKQSNPHAEAVLNVPMKRLASQAQ